MSEEKLVPKLRFQDYQYEFNWEEKKLSDIIDDFIVPMRDKPKRFGGSIPWTRLEDIQGRYIKGTLSNQYVTKKTIDEMNLKIIPKDSLIVSASATFGVVAIVKNKLITNQTFIGLVPKKNNDINFLYIFFKSEQARTYMKEKSAGSTIFYISKKDFESMKIYTPVYKEQQEIGLFFKIIDQMIQLQQSKVNKVKDIKSAYLSEMFPKEGEKYPKKRFEGFTEPWKEYNLGQVANIRTGYPFKSHEFSNDGKYLVITNGNIQDSLPIVDNSIGNRITMNNPRVVDEYVLNAGDILVTMDGTVGRTAKVIKKNQILAQRVGRLTAYENAEFLYQALQTGDFSKNMSLIGHGGTIKHISLSEIGSYKIAMPNPEEQNKVAEFLKNLDNQILIEEEKLAKIEKLKQAYLNDMFV